MRTLITIMMVLTVFSVRAQTPADDGFDHRHQALTEVLQRYVVVYDEGRKSVVDYAALNQSPEALAAYLSELSSVSSADYKTWTADQQLTFLINAYNAFTLELIVDHYERFATGDADSIRDLGGFFSTAWEREFFELLGAKRSLDWLEHGTIRVDFDEPRIHAALICAAMSCPKLPATAFVAAGLDDQLENQMQTFLSDHQKNGIDEQGLYLSRIFDWYEQDFGDLRAYMRDYSDALADNEAEARALEGDIRIRYTDYDWTLNSKENADL